MVKCLLCSKEFKNSNALSKHLKFCKQNPNKLKSPNYYLKFIEPDFDPFCPHCKREGIETALNFKSIEKGFYHLCDKHNRIDPEKFKKTADTLKERFEGGHPSRDPNVRNFRTCKEMNPALNKKSLVKRTKTRSDKMGIISKNISKGLLDSDKVEEGREKAKQTCIDRYGVDNGAKSDIAKINTKKAFEKYEGGHPLRDPEVKKRLEKTNLRRYGVKNIAQHPIIIEQNKHNNLKKYGYTTILLSPKFIEKTKKENIKRWGVDHYSKTQEFSKMTKDQNKNRVLY